MKVVVKVGDRVFEVEIENISARPIVASVEGEKFEVWPENPLPAASDAVSPTGDDAQKAGVPGADKPAVTTSMNLSGKTMTSPLPGVVIEVFVKAGESIEAGHVLLIIEAMKMKNSIRATRAGRISAVMVNAGETVAHKQPLIEFTE
jgi:glutaconyl-CoA/methylmalonyl-CoA decarboxylase subunit gamma